MTCATTSTGGPLGLLRDAANGTITLSGRGLVGRSAACMLRISDARVSSEHAVVAWTGDGWTVRDLGSRNGTTVDGQPCARETRLVRGSVISFAGTAPHTLVHDGPPVPQAEDVDSGEITTAAGDVLTLPPGEAPVISIVPADGLWTCVDDDTRLVGNLDILVVERRRWRLHLPTVIDPTIAATAVGLTFEVSPDEEQVSVRIEGGGRSASLRPRGHHYLLLLLARARMADKRHDPADRGWVHRDELARMLRCDPGTINVQLHRVRQDLASHGIDRAASLLEVRPRSGQVRVGTERLEIVRRA